LVRGETYELPQNRTRQMSRKRRKKKRGEEEAHWKGEQSANTLCRQNRIEKGGDENLRRNATGLEARLMFSHLLYGPDKEIQRGEKKREGREEERKEPTREGGEEKDGGVSCFSSTSLQNITFFLVCAPSSEERVREEKGK